MIKRRIILGICSAAVAIPLTCGAVSAASAEVAINETNFPDATFRDIVKSCDLDKNGSLSSYERSQVTSLDCAMYKIESLKGVEYFTDLIELNCYDNSLKELDLSACTKLESLDMRVNPGITGIDLSHNTRLKILEIERSPIKELDLSKNTVLEELMCCETEISKLDVSVCPNLISLQCPGNPNLTAIDVCRNPDLEILACGACAIKTLDVSQNVGLKQLSCPSCGLTELDLSHNARLASLYIQNNKIKTLDLSANSKMETLSCGKTLLTEIDLSHCPDLCILDCAGLNLSGLDLSGCTKLETLVCEDAHLRELDLTHCPELESLSCSWNQLETLDLSQNSKLMFIHCFGNKLKSLDLSNNPRMTYVDCSQNELKEIRLNKSVEQLACSYNPLGKIDLSGLPELRELSADDCGLSVIDFSRNRHLNTASVRFNKLSKTPTVPKDAALEFFPQMYQLNVRNLRVQSRTGNTVTLAWDKLVRETEDDVFHFEIWRATDPDADYVKIGASGKCAHSFVDEQAEENATYYYKINCVFSNGSAYVPEKQEIRGALSEALTVEPGAQGEGGSFEDFVERLYTVALNRTSDPEGKAFWVKQVVEEGKTGADCARFFLLTAPEFMDRNLSVEDFVETLYATFFDRASDAAGKQGWVDAISSGKKSRAEVVNDFIESTEWCDVCASYGVKSGALYHKATKASANAINFATRLYTCCLKRDAEDVGLKYWSLALTNLEKTGAEAAQFFFESEEFIGYKTGNEEYLMRLYTTFMDRAPSADEVTFWIGEIAGGRQTRHSILAFFAQSPEFTDICKKYGIDRGTIATPAGVYSAQQSDTDIAIDEKNFPDKAFREYIRNFDKDGNRFLSQSERDAVTEILCDGFGITSLKGIGFFSEITVLSCADNKIESMDLSGNTELTELWCAGNKLRKLDVSVLPKLRELHCSENLDLIELDLSENPKLTSLYMIYTGISKIDLSPCPNLTVFKCAFSPIEKLDLSKTPKLLELDCEETKICELDLSGTPALEILWCDKCDLGTLDLDPVCLKNLSCSGCGLSTLDLSRQQSLEYLRAFANEFSDIDLRPCNHLSYCNLNFNLLSELDISNCPELSWLDIRYCYFKKAPQGASQIEMFLWLPQRYIGKVECLKLESQEQLPVILSWSRVEEAVAYQVFRADSENGEYTQIAETQETMFDDETAQTDHIYYYKVRAYKTLEDYSGIFPGEYSEILKVDTAGWPESSQDSGFERFIERLYTIALERESDPDGKAYWTSAVVEEGKTGADCARFFLLEAPEFMSRNLSVENFVETLYATFFDRVSDAAGKQGWVDAISSGKKSRAEVVNDFIESTEWCDVCASYGVKSGALYHKATKASANAIRFATRLYTCCLKRDAEDAGLKYWSLALTNLEKTGAEAAQFFFESEEFIGYKTGNEEYLMRLYTTFMDRAPSADEVTFWIGEIAGGRQTRHSILAFFAQSPEFTDICKKYAIDRGTIA